MTPELAAALSGWGPTGALIAVVMIFLKFIEKRDAESQAFFKALHISDDQKSDKIAEALEKLTDILQEHDMSTKQAIAKMEERTRPYSRTQE